MGQDIHCKTLVFSKVENKYIDGMSLTTSSSDDTSFSPMFTGRSYQLFSVFGSHRGDKRELTGYIDGLPDFTPDTYKKYLIDIGNEYYGYKWWNINDFISNLENYLEMMKDPKIYFDEDDYIQDLLQSGEFDFKSYDMEMQSIRSWLKEMLEKAKNILQDEFCQEYLDLSKTVFLFYFDS